MLSYTVQYGAKLAMDLEDCAYNDTSLACSDMSIVCCDAPLACRII